jgi:hypothetical protein
LKCDLQSTVVLSQCVGNRNKRPLPEDALEAPRKLRVKGKKYDSHSLSRVPRTGVDDDTTLNLGQTDTSAQDMGLLGYRAAGGLDFSNFPQRAPFGTSYTMDEPLNTVPTSAAGGYDMDEPFDVSLTLATITSDPHNTLRDSAVRAPFSTTYTMDEPYSQPCP